MRTSVILLFLFALTSHSFGQSFYDVNVIQRVDIYFSQPNWDYQLDTLKLGSDGFLSADSIKVNGTLFANVGVKYKGNSSYDSTYIKNPLHISLDEFISQDYQGYTTIKLGNGYSDPSLIREVLSYGILRNYMHCPQANFAEVFINGDYLGLYSNVESINKNFCSTHFYSNDGAFVKCNPILNPSPSTKSNLKFISNDSTAYYNYYELKSDFGWGELIHICDVVTNQPQSVDGVLDMDRAIWMLAFDQALVNLDSYLGVFAQNYYLYRDHQGKFNPIVWDLNMSIGGFPYIGGGNSSMGALTIDNMTQLSPTAHSTDAYWPLIKLIMGNERYKKKYVAHLKTIMLEVLNNSDTETQAQYLHNLITPSAQADIHQFFSITEFDASLTDLVSAGNYDVPGVATFLSDRGTFLSQYAGITAAQPILATTSITPPVLNATFDLTVQSANADSVWFGYRFDPSEHFTISPAYDDGNHNDGSASDGIWGASIFMDGVDLQYYVYAENASAGAFMPARAEYEFLHLQASYPLAQSGDLFINEFMASNQTGITDANGEHEDWIELYNPTNQPVSLSGLFISDDISLPQKFAFSSSDQVPAHGRKILWADQDTDPTETHLNFKLSAAGEAIILSNLNGEILDSVIFGATTTDWAQARCPDGIGPWVTQAATPLLQNCPLSIFEHTSAGVIVSPNPATSHLHLQTMESGTHEIAVYNSIGNCVLTHQFIGKAETISIDGWAPGLYYLRMDHHRMISIVH